MVGQQAERDTARETADALVVLVAVEGSAAHRHVRTTSLVDTAEATRNATDAIHHLCMLHGRHPGVIDHAAARTTETMIRGALFAAADVFSAERGLLAKLVVAAGPLPSTPGQAETEASVIAQHHAIEMLAQSDRSGCAIGAAIAVMLDWHAIRPVLDAAARRFGVNTTPLSLPDRDALRHLARSACPTPATERAMMFGAQQIATQHRGLWDLLEARSIARAASH